MNRIKGILFAFILSTSILSCSSQVKKPKDFSESSGIVIRDYDQKTIENLAVLCKVWGYLKFYHPSISMGNYNMDYELFSIMPDILNAKSKEDRNKKLGKWIESYGKIESSRASIMFPPERVKVYPALDWIENKTELGSVSEQLVKIKEAKRDNDTTSYVIFPYGPSAFLWKENKYLDLPSMDTGYRLAGLFRLWNSVEYYFAYKYLIDGNWDDILEEFIPQFISTDGGLGYKLAVLKLLTRLEDSHARIMHPKNGTSPAAIHPEIADWEGKYMLPFEITFVEDKAVITDSYPIEDSKMYPFRVGDVILSVDDESVESIIKRKLEYTPASHYVGKLKKIATAILRSDEPEISVEYERDGKIMSGTFKAFLYADMEIPNRTRKDLPGYTKMKDGIAYIYLGSTRGGSLPEEFDSYTKGVIIDLRCFPNSLRNYWGYKPLFRNPVVYAYCTAPSTSFPGLFTYKEGTRAGSENPNYFKGKKVLLINEYTQSQPEFLAMQYGCAPNTTLIGSKTTGADGNVSVVALPGMEVMFTGVGVYYPDGRETQRVGILPDIEVKPTIKGIREGRDEVLERAIDFILKD